MMKLSECKMDHSGLEDWIRSSKLCPAIITTPKAVTTDVGR